MKKLLQKYGFKEYPEQLMALGFAKELFSSGATQKDIEALIDKILVETGEDFNFDEENKARW